MDHSGKGPTGDAPRNEVTSRKGKKDEELREDEGKARDGQRGGDPRGGGTRLVGPEAKWSAEVQRALVAQTPPKA